MNQIENKSSSVIFDNWAIQNSVLLLTKSVNPLAKAPWLTFDDGDIGTKSASVAAVSFHCLCSFLENLVLYDKILVKSGWSSGYKNKIKELDDLLNSKVIEELEENPETSKEHKEYIEYLSKDARIESIIDWCAKTKNDYDANYIGLIINGAVAYLSMSASTGFAYTPHPLRKLFLNDKLYKLTSPRGVAINKFNELINNSRVRLKNKMDSNSFLLHLSTKIPAISLFCILESTDQVSPIKVACQLKEDKNFSKLREKLNYINTLFHANDTEKYIKEVTCLETVIKHAEKKINLRKLGENDGFSSLTFFKYLPVKIPESLRKPIFTPKHTVSIAKLIKTVNADIRNKLQNLFGSASISIIEDLELLS